ncbi:MAG: GldG family protein [Armatimonadota bacterium]
MQEKNEFTPRLAKDPRLLPVQDNSLSALVLYGRMAGWAGSVLLLAALFWASIVHTVNHTPVKIIGILALVCLAFWVYSNIHQLVIAVRTRGFQTALNSALFTVLILAILVMVNYIGVRRDFLRYDFTKNHQYSLSDATVKLLNSLEQKVKITAFVSNEAYNSADLRRLLNEYKLKSSKLDVEVYDFKTAVDKAQEYGARFDGTMFVEAGEADAKKKEEIQGGTEEQITSAILAVTTGQKTRLCFLTGHGEASLEAGTSQDQAALTMLKGVLENQQYQCDTLNLMTQKQPQVPADCKALIIAGAKYAPSAAEMTAIAKYVDQGGNLLLMLEPAPAPNFAELLKSHGVTPLAGKVTDPMNSAQGEPAILATIPQNHDVVRGVQLVVLPVATAFDVEEQAPPPAMPGAPPPPNNQNAVAVLQTSDAATLSGAGRRGPFKMAIAIDETPKPPAPFPGQEPQPEPEGPRKARLMVVGDADFATDRFLPALGGYGRQNLGFATMSVNWLVKNEKLIAIPPKEPVEKPFTVTDPQKRFTWVLTVGIVPLLIILAGGLMWWTRRRV